MTNASVLSEKKPPLTIQIWCNTATLWPQMHYRRFIRTLKILFTLWSLELFPNSKHVSITGGTITLYISYADCRKVTMYYLHPPCLPWYKWFMSLLRFSCSFSGFICLQMSFLHENVIHMRMGKFIFRELNLWYYKSCIF